MGTVVNYPGEGETPTYRQLPMNEVSLLPFPEPRAGVGRQGVEGAPSSFSSSPSLPAPAVTAPSSPRGPLPRVSNAATAPSRIQPPVCDKRCLPHPHLPVPIRDEKLSGQADELLDWRLPAEGFMPSSPFRKRPLSSRDTAKQFLHHSSQPGLVLETEDP